MDLEKRVVELRTYVEFDDEDAKCLEAVRDVIAPDFPRIAQGFYDKIRENEEAHAVFTGEDQIARLQKSLEAWMHRLLGGTYDAAYYTQTQHIGEVHVRVGLPQRYMFTAMALIRLELTRLVDARAPKGSVTQTRAALHKAIDLELAVMLEAYRDADVARLQRTQEVERDELESSLARSERRYDVAVELTQELVIALDGGGIITRFNGGAESITGFRRDEVIGRTVAGALLAGESRAPFDALIAIRPERLQHHRLDVLVKTPSGALRNVHLEIARTPVGAILIGHDTTDEKAQAERTHQTERLASVGTLAAGLAHEIRNPLNGAQLHLAYLERTLKRTNADAEILEAVGVVGDEIKRLAVLVSEFLDFARPKPLTRTTVSLALVVERAAQLLDDDARQAHVVIVRDLPSKDIVADIDRDKIEQVLLNIARNAVEAVGSQGNGHVTMRLRRQPSHAVIEIEDDGPGLPGSDAPIFDAFYTDEAARHGPRPRHHPSHRHGSRRQHRRR